MRRTIIFVLAMAVSAAVSSCGDLMESSGLAAPSSLPSTTNIPSSTASFTVTPSVTATLDPCSTRSLPDSIKPINELMRQFDDYATLARTTPSSQLVQVIPPMQNIRRNTEDLAAPACLQQLKSYETSYMDTFLQTMLVFESTAGNPVVMMTPAIPQAIRAGIAQAQKYHDQYMAEMARLLGVTLAPSPTPLIGTPIPGTGTPAPTPLSITITNPTTDGINLHQLPSVNSPIVGKLNAGASANAIGKSAAGDWLLIQIPKESGKTAWIYAPLITFNSGDVNALPLTTPSP